MRADPHFRRLPPVLTVSALAVALGLAAYSAPRRQEVVFL